MPVFVLFLLAVFTCTFCQNGVQPSLTGSGTNKFKGVILNLFGQNDEKCV